MFSKSFGTLVTILVLSVPAGSVAARPQIGPPAPNAAEPGATGRGDVGAAAERNSVAAPAAIETRPLAAGGASDRADPAKGANAEAAQSAFPAAKVAGSLALVIVVIGALAVAVRRGAKSAGGILGSLGAGGRAPSGVMFVLGRYPVSRQSTLVLLQLDRRVLLLCQTHGRGNGGAMSTLTEITDPAEVASILTKTRDADGSAAARKFEEALAAADFTTANVVDDEPVAGGLRDRLGSIRRLAMPNVMQSSATAGSPVGGRAAGGRAA